MIIDSYLRMLANGKSVIELSPVILESLGYVRQSINRVEVVRSTLCQIDTSEHLQVKRFVIRGVRCSLVSRL